MAAALDLADVLRRHAASQAAPAQQDPALRRMRAEHLKARGDEAIKQGNYREAWERYGESIALQPPKDMLRALHANRSLAYCKAGRHADALSDADAAVALAPSWPKAHWRRSAALAALRRAPEAALAFRDAWRLDPSDAESAARLWAAVQRLTREQLGRGVLGLLGELQAAGELEPPRLEEATEAEQGEAMFSLLRAAHKGAPRPGPYYRRYTAWLQQGMSPGEAYLERSAMHASAKCYLQARADAQAAVAALTEALRQAQAAQQAQQAAQESPEAGKAEAAAAPSSSSGGGCGAESSSSSSAAALRSQLALAYRRLGDACLAEKAHPDRSCRLAAKAFTRAAELLGPGSGGGRARGGKRSAEEEAAERAAAAVQEGLAEASEELTVEELAEIQEELYHEGAAAGSSADGSRPPAGQRLLRVVLRLAFPSASAADCSSRARELLRAGVAATAGVEPGAVSIERIAAPSAARRQPHLAITLHVSVGPHVLKAAALARAVNGEGSSEGSGGSGSTAEQQVPTEQQPPSSAPGAAAAASEASPRVEQLVAALGGQPLVAVLGRPDPAHCSADVEDVTPACAAGSEAERAQQEAVNRGDAAVAPQEDRRLAAPARPKLELELPYRLYRLVRADGAPAERADKHPFCMSRVYYDASEKPEEVWAELLDGSCRWRQTGGEVKVLALRVPAALPARQLAVDIQPYALKVWNRASGEVYLEGGLERGVVPEDCFWTHCGGAGEDGCALSLRKMNLEVLQKHWQHSEMWWPRLFRHHGEIAWDDYEKDYSDLPEEVLARHRVAEAIKDAERRVEGGERERREALQELEDLRKRTRQERLNELRTGSRRSWTALHRGLPAPPTPAATPVAAGGR